MQVFLGRKPAVRTWLIIDVNQVLHLDHCPVPTDPIGSGKGKEKSSERENQRTVSAVFSNLCGMGFK